MRTRILLVEDENTLRETIKLNLELEGYVVRAATNATEAFQYFQEERFNLIILDVMMPGMTGLDLSERIRLENREIPILFLSAKGTAEDRVKGLKAGGNDYLAKPFNLEELLLRVGILVRTSLQGQEKRAEIHEFQFGSNSVNFQTMEAVTYHGSIQLTKRESRLLQLLVDKKKPSRFSGRNFGKGMGIRCFSQYPYHR